MAAVAFVALCLLHLVSSLPWPHSSWPPQIVDECLTNEDVLTFCQKCAKTTQSPIIYPMCCEEREEARTWCDKYMNFGRPSS